VTEVAAALVGPVQVAVYEVRRPDIVSDALKPFPVRAVT